MRDQRPTCTRSDKSLTFFPVFFWLRGVGGVVKVLNVERL